MSKQIEDEKKRGKYAELEARQKAEEVKKKAEYEQALIAADRARCLGQKPETVS